MAFGLSFIPASLDGILLATEPIWILLLSLAATHMASLVNACGNHVGITLAALGVGLGTAMSGTENIALTGPQILGAGLTLLAACMWSAYTVLIRPLTHSYGAQNCTGLTTIIGTMPLMAFYNQHLIPNLAHFGSLAWIALLLLTAGSTVIATILWNYGVASMPSAQAGLFLYLVPLVSVVGGHFFLHETIIPGVLFSGIFILLGVCIAQTQQFTKSHTQRETATRS